MHLTLLRGITFIAVSLTITGQVASQVKKLAPMPLEIACEFDAYGLAEVTSFGADPTGLADSSAAIQAAVDSLPTTGGTVVFPPGTYLITAEEPTVVPGEAAIGAEITTDNVHIMGIGRPTIRMKGIGSTPAYLNTIEDTDNGSGRDVFTAFSFAGINNGSVRNLHIEGEWNGQGTLNYSSPRAKGVGFLGCDGVSVTNVTGRGILGNLVNATPLKGVGGCSNMRVENCRAELCLENGFNFMGGTAHGVFVGNIARNCGANGFEAATDNLVCSNNLFAGNRHAGAGLGGANVTFSGNVSVDNGVDPNTGSFNASGGFGLVMGWSAVTESSRTNVTGNVFSRNANCAIQVYGGFRGARISDNLFHHNSRNPEVHAREIDAVGSGANTIRDLSISSNEFTDEESVRPANSYTVNLSYVERATIQDNTVDTAHEISIVAQGSCSGIRAQRNRTNHGTSVSLNAVSSFASPQWTPPDEDKGPYDIGEIVYNSAPQPGTYVGWIYTAAGWQAFGKIGDPCPEH